MSGKVGKREGGVGCSELKGTCTCDAFRSRGRDMRKGVWNFVASYVPQKRAQSSYK